ncbi:PIG-L family deacetylase [Wukongibacter baidiensis]|uniref:PIG-L deacetylase family protein n=1 Tax=Wukongibacter baidiensis TaxID=1723361 RepID=UPI003D7F77AE
MMKKVVVISPHPDDETLGCGGTILRYKELGYKIYWINMTDMKIEYGYDERRVEKRSEEIDKVCKMYEFDGFYNLELRPAYLDTYPKSEIIMRISEIISELEPNIVILPYENDIHSDHKVTFDCIYSCSKIFRHPSIKKILAMEIISETDFALGDKGFLPNYFVDVTNYLEKKLEIMKIYESELGRHPFPRSEDSINALATLRGVQAGVEYAEGFRLIKYIE